MIADRAGAVPVTTWPAPRRHPFAYPGTAPDHAHLLVGDEVVPLDVRRARGPSGSGGSGGPSGSGLRVRTADGTPVDDVLARSGAVPLAARVPVVSYGANRSPHTLALKLDHHGYEPPGPHVVVPVLSATVAGLDVVVGGLSAQGFLRAGVAPSPGTGLRVLVALLDPGQLRALHDSEGLGVGYDAAVRPGVAVDAPGAGPPGPGGVTLDALLYVGRDPVFVSPEAATPLAFAAVPATGRRFPALDQLDAVGHVLRATGLLAEVAGLLGQPPGTDERAVAADLVRLLNGQWWYVHNTGDHPAMAATAATDLVRRAMRSHGAAPSTHDPLGRPLSVPEAHAGGPRSLRLGAQLSIVP